MTIPSKFREKASALLIPWQVTLELTYRCNERCGHCYLATYDDKADGRPPFTQAEWCRVLDELAEAGAFHLVLIGGEAMMHPQFWGVAEHGARRNFALNLITNGLLVDEGAADRLAALGFYHVTLSLYSREPRVHDAMTRRAGSHERTLAAIERLRARGVGVGLNCLLTARNIDGCFELEDWARAQGLPLAFDPMVTPKTDGGLASTETRATSEQLLAYLRGLRDRGRVSRPAPAGEATDPICNAGRGKCAVNPYGDLLTCLEVRSPIGNLRDASFAELWHSPQADRLRNRTVGKLRFNANCGDGAFCDHCPGMAEAEVGSPFAPVPFLMELARLKRLVHDESTT